MKTLINIQFLLLFMSTWSMAQVTVSIKNVVINGATSVQPCQNIDFGSNSSISISSTIEVLRNNNTYVGLGSIRLYHKKAAGGRITLISYGGIFQSSWFWGSGNTRTYSVSANTSLTASDVSSGDKLVAVFRAYNGTEYSSCEYPLNEIKQPSFSFSPTSKTLPCGTTTPSTFRVTAQNAPGVTYEWNVGHGWATTTGTPVSNIITTSSNQLTLVPHNYPYSDIRVTPILKGKRYTTMICQMSLTPYYSTGYIVGNNPICSGSSVYTMYNLQNGETVAWSVSDPSLATISNATNSQVTLTKVGNGNVKLTGVISNSCNQSNTRVLLIGLGAPTITKPHCGGLTPIPIDQFPFNDASCDLCRSNYYYADKNMIEAEATGGHNLTWEWEQLSTNFSWSTQQHRAHFLPYNFGTISFRVRAGNACGLSAWIPQQINITQNCVDDNDNGQEFRMAENSNSNSKMKMELTSNYFNAYPNPASSVINLELVTREHSPNKKAEIFAELYDFYGSTKAKVILNDYNAQINISQFPKGLYILKISVDGNIETHQISVE